MIFLVYSDLLLNKILYFIIDDSKPRWPGEAERVGAQATDAAPVV